MRRNQAQGPWTFVELLDQEWTETQAIGHESVTCKSCAFKTGDPGKD